jgi:hypothetical protein
MPGPFPGMDPYLENRRFWSDVHHSMIYALRAALNPVLPSEFLARIEERLYIVEPPAIFVPTCPWCSHGSNGNSPLLCSPKPSREQRTRPLSYVRRAKRCAKASSKSCP